MGRSVTLLAEGADRNYVSYYSASYASGSPSSRRAWIEMICSCLRKAVTAQVALLAEGVDRNWPDGIVHRLIVGRPPCGGRG